MCSKNLLFNTIPSQFNTERSVHTRILVTCFITVLLFCALMHGVPFTSLCIVIITVPVAFFGVLYVNKWGWIVTWTPCRIRSITHIPGLTCPTLLSTWPPRTFSYHERKIHGASYVCVWIGTLWCWMVSVPQDPCHSRGRRVGVSMVASSSIA